jgi:hypothetical protein
MEALESAVTEARDALQEDHPGYAMEFGIWNYATNVPQTDMTRADLVPEYDRAADFLMGIDGSSYDPDHDVRTFIDFMAPGLYTFSDDQVEWGRTAKLILDESARFGLPVYPWLDPALLGGPAVGDSMAGDRWRHQLELVRSSADGLDVWGWSNNWTSTEPWWLATQDFLNPTATGAPSAPTGLAIAVGPKLTWSAPSGGQTPYGYQIEKQTNGGAWQVVAVTPETSWEDTRVHAGQVYAYRVRSMNAFGTSSAITSSTAAPVRDAFNFTPAVDYDAEASSTTSWNWWNESGENTRAFLAATGQYIRFDNVHFAEQPHRIDVDMATEDAGAGGTLEAWLEATSGVGAKKIGSMIVKGTGPSHHYVVQQMFVSADVNLSIPHTLFFVFKQTVGSANQTAQSVFLHSFQFHNSHPTQDTSTGGAWKAHYGGEGAWTFEDHENTHLPGAELTFSGASPDQSIFGTGALDWLTIPGAAFGGAMSSTTSFTVDVAFRDDVPHRLSGYFFAGNSTTARVQTVELLDANDNVIQSQTLSSFATGKYLSWVVGGHVKLRVTRVSGDNAVISGLFVDSIGEFNFEDATTQGAWKGRYGSEFAYVGGVSTTYPSFMNNFGLDTLGGSTNYIGDYPDEIFPTEISGTGVTKYVDYWWGAGSFDLDLNDNKLHQLTLYFSEGDPKIENPPAPPVRNPDYQRTLVISLYNADDHTLIDSRSVGNLLDGRYVSWNVSGHVLVRLTAIGGPNTILSGVFLDPVGGGHAHNDPATQGNWNWSGTYGSQGAYVPDIQALDGLSFDVAPDLVSWDGGADPYNGKFLQDPTNLSLRTDVTAAWDSNTAAFDLDLADGKLHQAALFFLNGDGQSRKQRIDLFDADTGKFLDSRVVDQFYAGMWVVFNVSGHVRFELTALSSVASGHPATVLGGVFLDSPATWLA